MIQEFFNNPEVIALISTFLGFCTTNFVTLIVFACKYIKLKNQEMKNKLQSEAVIEELTAEYNKKINEFAERVDKSLNKVESVIIKKVEEKDRLREEEINKETILLQQAIEDTKKQLEKNA